MWGVGLNTDRETGKTGKRTISYFTVLPHLTISNTYLVEVGGEVGWAAAGLKSAHACLQRSQQELMPVTLMCEVSSLKRKVEQLTPLASMVNP